MLDFVSVRFKFNISLIFVVHPHISNFSIMYLVSCVLCKVKIINIVTSWGGCFNKNENTAAEPRYEGAEDTADTTIYQDTLDLR